jgi:hypothetical protein
MHDIPFRAGPSGVLRFIAEIVTKIIPCAEIARGLKRPVIFWRGALSALVRRPATPYSLHP